MVPVVVLEEIILSYFSKNSNVHSAMIDLSMAFDKINISKLIFKLKNSELPTIFVEFMSYMFLNTIVQTKVCGTSGEEWNIGNGARQGGVRCRP